MSPLTFIFMGRSGCGKGVQAKNLQKYIEGRDADKRSVVYVETGSRFRAFVASQSHAAALAREINDNKGLQPEFLAIWNWAGALIDTLHGGEHIIFDGIMRRLDEAKVFVGAMKFFKREKPVVIHLNVSRAFSEKLMRGRARGDDDEEGIKRRLDWYDTEVEPVISHLKSEKPFSFVEINGEQTIEEVRVEIIAKLEKEGIV